MDKNNSQLELFSSSQAEEQPKVISRGNFFGRIRGLEKLFLLIIAFIVTSIISFSFGVEKGKQIADSRSNVRLDMALNKTLLPKTSTEVASLVPKPSQRPRSNQPQIQQQGVTGEAVYQETVKVPSGSYTVQVATYQTKSAAFKEAELLKKKGLTPIVKSQGMYIVVCVGSFSDKQAAKLASIELKKKYKDCLIRRL